jgi:hypothetical protein
METAMQAIIVDATNRSLRVVEYDGDSDIETLKRETGIEWITSVWCFGSRRNALFVDDEGVLKGWDFGFCVAGYPNPLHGSGFIVGVNAEGESIDPTLTVEGLLDRIAFWRLDEGGEMGFLTARQASQLN